MSSPLFKLEELPTPIAITASRVNVTGTDDLSNCFLTTSYVFEAFLKTIVVALNAGLKTQHAEHAYRHAHALLRADGLGTWVQSLQEMTAHPLSSFIPSEMSPFLAWTTKKIAKPDNQSTREAYEAAQRVLAQLGAEFDAPRKPNVFHLLWACVEIRNKTKAHGAVDEEFYRAANADYIAAIVGLLTQCPVMKWKWVRVYRTPANDLRVVWLNGPTPERLANDATRAFESASCEGIYILPDKAQHSFACGLLHHSDRQCKNFYWPNGGFASATSKAEFINYANGITKKVDAFEFVEPPAPLPRSETHAPFVFDIQSSVFGNLPSLPERYINRPQLQDDVLARLTDRNHTIITLHGRGGVGKTYLALHAAHYISNMSPPPFECIVWLSARDIDLRTQGVGSVHQDVATLADMSRAVGTLFGIGEDRDSFAQILQDPSRHVAEGRGILWILDNFETLADVLETHRFLDTHTHLPNKILITSKERAFKADYPIEVRGMEFAEAEEMVKAVASEFEISHLVNDKVIHELYDYTCTF